MFEAKILLDSISETGKRLTTFEATFPRIVLAEFNTHRMISKNSASSRAIPFKKQLERVMTNPFIPERFPVNCSGMQPQEYYLPNKKGFSVIGSYGRDTISRWIKPNSYKYEIAVEAWLRARDAAVKEAKRLVGEDEAALEYVHGDFRSDVPVYLNVHKQIANRLLEPFMWHTAICSATEFDNFFKLRTHGDAQFELKRIADLMYDAYHYYDDKDEDDFSWGVGDDPDLPPPQNLMSDEWHTPLVYAEDTELIEKYWKSGGYGSSVPDPLLEIKKKVSTARTARVSYLTHDGKRDISKDMDLFSKLSNDPLHASPLEHVARPYHEEIGRDSYDTIKNILDNPSHPLHYTYKEMMQVSHYNNRYWKLPRLGNFYGYLQYRKEFPNENCAHFRK
jgi:hypothetical protein